MELSRPVWLGVVLVFLGGYRLLLIQSGQLYWPDEYRYLHVLHFLDELRRVDPGSALNWVFGDLATQGGVASQPSYIFLSIVPAAFQGVANVVFNVQPDDPSFYRIPAVANVIVSLALALVFYRIVLRLTGDRRFALLGLFVYGLLANTNLYVRHLFPYDLALLLFLTAVLVLLDEPGASRLSPRNQAAMAGILSGTAMTTYPGYNPFMVILVAVIVARHWGEWRRLVVFVAGLASVFLCWELVSRAGGLSFIESLRQFSRLYSAASVQGSTSESFSFLVRYLWNVEGIEGITLLALFLCFLAMAVRGKFDRTETALIGTASVVFLAFAAFSVMSNRIALYGRLLHMYFPFLVIGSILAVSRFPVPYARRAAVVILLSASVVSFVPNTASALAIRFPRGVERGLRASFSGDPTICDMRAPGTGETGGASEQCDFLVENVRHLYPLPLIFESAPPSGFELTNAYKHPLQFTPYWFEGFSPDERARLLAHPPVMRIYARHRSE